MGSVFLTWLLTFNHVSSYRSSSSLQLLKMNLIGVGMKCADFELLVTLSIMIVIARLAIADVSYVHVLTV